MIYIYVCVWIYIMFIYSDVRNVLPSYVYNGHGQGGIPFERGLSLYKVVANTSSAQSKVSACHAKVIITNHNSLTIRQAQRSFAQVAALFVLLLALLLLHLSLSSVSQSAAPRAPKARFSSCVWGMA